MTYSPSSRILLVTLGSLHQLDGGAGEYTEVDSIFSRLPANSSKSLNEIRSKAFEWLKEDNTTRWQGVLVSEHKSNKQLVRGRDFGGHGEAMYYPALDRFTGRLYRALGRDGQEKLRRSRHHVLLLCALYGLMMPLEPIQLYNCPVSTEWEVFRIWTDNNALTNILLDYIEKHKIIRVFDLTATQARRELISWPTLHERLPGNVLHCFDSLAAGPDALFSFGELMGSFLLEASEDELSEIKPGMERGNIVFQALPEPPEDFPHEDEIRIIREAEQEIPALESYSVQSVAEVLHGKTHPGSQKVKESSARYLSGDGVRPAGKDWLISIASEFRKEVSPLDKKMQGRVMVAITDICRNPMKYHGDTVKPLSGELAGKWRYRLGDYRLIYLPDKARRTVFLLTICPRGSAYED